MTASPSTSPSTTETTLELIAALLRKAEHTDNEHEQDAFFTRAQTLATRNSIDLAVARSHTAKAQQREQVEERVIRIGTKGSQSLAAYVQLFLAIGRANDLQFLIARDSTKVYAHGFPSDIEVTEALYSSLVLQMVASAETFLKKGTYKAEQVWTPGRYKKVRSGSYYGFDEEWVEGTSKPVHGKVARRSFYQGFTSRIAARLREAQQAAEDAAEAEDALQATDVRSTASSTESTGKTLSSTALVIIEKKAEVTAWHAAEVKRQKIRGSYRGGRSTGSSRSSRQAGDTAGRSASLSSPSRGIGA